MKSATLPSAEAALALLEERLAARGAEAEYVLGFLHRLTEMPTAWGPVTLKLVSERDRPQLFLLRTGNRTTNVVAFESLGEGALGELVDALATDGPLPTRLSGEREATLHFARALAARDGRPLVEGCRMIAYEARSLVKPAHRPAGAFRRAQPSDARVLADWIDAFNQEAGIEASAPAASYVARLLPTGDLAVWENQGKPEAMAALTRHTPLSSCIGGVYTPKPYRDRGRASALVFEVAAEVLARKKWCSLFADAENPTSNNIYRALGFEPRCEYQEIAIGAE